MQYSQENLLQEENSAVLEKLFSVGRDVSKPGSEVVQGTPLDKRLVILGDMFYDSDFARAVFGWLKR